MPDQDFQDLEKLFAEMDAAADRAEAALEGKFQGAVRELRSLDPEKIRNITPDTTDEATYEKLMVIVQEASARNVSQAKLVERIRGLGEITVRIAKKVPALAVMGL